MKEKEKEREKERERREVRILLASVTKENGMIGPMKMPEKAECRGLCSQSFRERAIT